VSARKPVAKKPGRSQRRDVAAAEVLEAVWLKDFELEHKIDSPPVVTVDDEGARWVHVRILVPQLDVDLWEEGTHYLKPRG
jgi:hypothetical protein